MPNITPSGSVIYDLSRPSGVLRKIVSKYTYRRHDVGHSLHIRETVDTKDHCYLQVYHIKYTPNKLNAKIKILRLSATSSNNGCATDL